MKRFEQLRSERLILRRLQLTDAAALSSYRSLPEVARYQSWSAFNPGDAANLIRSQLTAEPDVAGVWFQMAITSAETGMLMGDCGLYCRRDDPRQMEIGITLSPEYQGHGYAYETVENLLAYAFVVLGKHRLSASTDVNNLRAARLFRRLGFRQEAHHVEHLWFKGGWGSEYIFALLSREWVPPETVLLQTT